MTRFRKSLTAAAAGIALIVLQTAPSLADMDAAHGKSAGNVQPVQMSQGQGAETKQQHGHMGMMGPGMMGPGMMGAGMMGPGMMGPGMMGPGMMGPGMMGPGCGSRVVSNQDLSTDDVRHFFEHRLEWHGNKRLKLGEVTEADDDTIVAEITTVDGSLVQRVQVDRHTGQMKQVD